LTDGRAACSWYPIECAAGGGVGARGGASTSATELSASFASWTYALRGVRACELFFCCCCCWPLGFFSLYSFPWYFWSSVMQACRASVSYRGGRTNTSRTQIFRSTHDAHTAQTILRIRRIVRSKTVDSVSVPCEFCSSCPGNGPCSRGRCTMRHSTGSCEDPASSW
jgi:hypothetical protein